MTNGRLRSALSENIANRWFCFLNIDDPVFDHSSISYFIDELGFVSLSTAGAELLFEVFSQRYERGSVLVTTNLPFGEWSEVFGSEPVTGALVDRLTHHVHILEMDGGSYRFIR